tara:strand:- start:25 stop:843 length:819 start_codon:yes stop_codon:yes gene_type:complete
MVFATNSSDRLTIDSSGRVGIGVTSPTEKLEVNGNIKFGDGHTIGNGGGDNLHLESSTGENIVFNAAGGFTVFQGGGTESMRIDSSGRVLVGNTDGLAKFCVGNGSGNALIEMASQSATAVYYEHINRSNVSGDVDVGYYARAAGEHTFYTGSYTARFIINSSGGSNASDEKLKENIQNLSYGLDTVKSLKPRQFKWKDNQQQSIGFVAQEVESLIPEVVSEVSANIKEGTDEKIKALNYANLTAVLTKAIQEQQDIIEDLQTQINEVKNGN